jgi:hypothetical protein
MTGRQRTARWMVSAGGLVIVGLLGGCGNDDDGADASDGRAELIADADAICERIDAEGEQLSAEVYGEDFSLEPTLEAQAEFLRRLVAGVEDGLAEIEALPGPADGKAILERVFSEDPFIADARAAIALADAGDEAGFETAMTALFDEGSDPDPALVEEARDYGFTSCVPATDDDGDHDDG